MAGFGVSTEEADERPAKVKLERGAIAWVPDNVRRVRRYPVTGRQKIFGYIRMSQLTKCAEDAVSSRFRRLSQGTQMAGNTRRNIEVTDGQIDHVGEVVQVAISGRAVLDDFDSGISVLPAPDGPFIHPRAAERTKLCSSHNRPAPEAVTSARADVRPTGAPAFRAFLRHRSTLVPFLRQAGFVALAARQPAGTGSAQILRSMSPNSRRVRCPSASRSQ